MRVRAITTQKNVKATFFGCSVISKALSSHGAQVIQAMGPPITHTTMGESLARDGSPIG
jgi:hypothetical protein